MLDRIRWQAPSANPTSERPLRARVNVTLDLSPDKPGQRSELEQALRTLFPGGYTRDNVRWFVRHAVRAVSQAVNEEGRGFFPLRVHLAWEDTAPAAPVAVPAETSNVVSVQFHQEQSAA